MAEYQQLHIMHASSQDSDPVRLTNDDLEFYWKKEPDIVTFTEMGTSTNPSHRRAMAKSARANGYKPLLGNGDCQIAVKTSKHLSVKKNGAIPVTEKNFIAWARLDFYGFDIFVHVAHWPEYAKKAQRAAMTQAMITQMQQRGKKHLAFMSGDLNVGSEQQAYPTRDFLDANMSTVWEDAGTQIPIRQTQGTITKVDVNQADFIGRYIPDRRITFVKYKVWPYQNSDHRPLSAYYAVNTAKKFNAGGGTGNTGGDSTPDDHGLLLENVYSFADYTDNELYNLPYAVDDSDTFNG